MMTQSVMTQVTNRAGNTAVSNTSKGKQSGNGFNLLIDSNLKTLQSTAEKSDIAAKNASVQNKGTNAESKSDDYETSPSQTDSVAKEQERTQAATVTKETKTAKQTTSNDNDALATAAQTTSDSGSETIDEQLLAEIVGMLQTVTQTVMDTLQLSQGEFDQLLTEQGMSVTDLLQPDKLQQFILASNGETDISAALTNENLATAMKDLMAIVDDITTEADLGLTKEQIDTILTTSSETTPANVLQDAMQLTTESSGIKADGEKLTKQTEAVNTINTSKEETTTVKTDAQEESTPSTAKLDGTKESGAGTGQDASNEEQKDLKAADQFQTFIDNMVKTSQESQVDFSGNLVRVTELRDIANQIIERIKVSVTTDQTSMELQLNPENLGKVNLTLQSKNGVMTAQFIVQNEISKEAIESQLHVLRETLNSQGIKVEAIEVTVASNAFEQNNQESSQSQPEAEKNSNGRQITMEEALNMTETSDSAEEQQDVTGHVGSQIDYTA